MLPIQTENEQLSDPALQKVQLYFQQYCTGENKQRYGVGHIVFACHAAFPLVLTPDLANLIWLNFNTYRSGDITRTIQQVTVSDFLLSPLVRKIGRRQYEVIPELRNFLLYLLKDGQWFQLLEIHIAGTERIRQLALFLKQYLAHHHTNDPMGLRSFRQLNTWASLSWLDPRALTASMGALLKTMMQQADGNTGDSGGQLMVSLLADRFSRQMQFGLSEGSIDDRNHLVNFSRYNRANIGCLDGLPVEELTLLYEQLDISSLAKKADENTIVQLPLHSEIKDSLYRKKTKVRRVQVVMYTLEETTQQKDFYHPARVFENMTQTMEEPPFFEIIPIREDYRKMLKAANELTDNYQGLTNNDFFLAFFYIKDFSTDSLNLSDSLNPLNYNDLIRTVSRHVKASNAGHKVLIFCSEGKQSSNFDEKLNAYIQTSGTAEENMIPVFVEETDFQISIVGTKCGYVLAKLKDMIQTNEWSVSYTAIEKYLQLIAKESQAMATVQMPKSRMHQLFLSNELHPYARNGYLLASDGTSDDDYGRKYNAPLHTWALLDDVILHSHSNKSAIVRDYLTFQKIPETYGELATTAEHVFFGGNSNNLNPLRLYWLSITNWALPVNIHAATAPWAKDLMMMLSGFTPSLRDKWSSFMLPPFAPDESDSWKSSLQLQENKSGNTTLMYQTGDHSSGHFITEWPVTSAEGAFDDIRMLSLFEYIRTLESDYSYYLRSVSVAVRDQLLEDHQFTYVIGWKDLEFSGQYVSIKPLDISLRSQNGDLWHYVVLLMAAPFKIHVLGSGTIEGDDIEQLPLDIHEFAIPAFRKSDLIMIKIFYSEMPVTPRFILENLEFTPMESIVRKGNHICKLGVVDIQVRAEEKWGLEDSLFSRLMKILSEMRNLSSIHSSKDRLSPPLLGYLVSYLNRQKYDCSDLPKAIAQFVSAYNMANDRSLIQLIQQQLNQFGQKPFTPPVTIPVNGKLGMDSSQLLRLLKRFFNLDNIAISEELLKVLGSILKRVVMIKPGNALPLVKGLENFFCLMNENSGNYLLEQNPKEKGYQLRENGNLIARFELDTNAGKAFYVRFTAWLSLLRTPGRPALQRKIKREFAEFEPGRYEISFDNEAFTTLSNFSKIWRHGESIIQPAYFSKMNPQQKSIHFIRHGLQPDGCECYIAFFQDTAEVTIIKARRIETASKKIIWNAEIPTSLWEKRHYQRTNCIIRRPANYIKIFLVKPDFYGYGANNNYESHFAAYLSPDFYRLLSSSWGDILDETLIGLEQTGFDIQPYNNKRILVVGTGEGKLPPYLQEISAAIGTSLAQHGYGLIVGGWQGVDEETAKAYANTIKTDWITRERLTQVISSSRRRLNIPSIVLGASNDADWEQKAVEAATAVILIGGAGGTYSLFLAALKAKVPIIPIPNSGGDAKRAWRYLMKNIKEKDRRLDINLELQVLPEPIAKSVINFLITACQPYTRKTFHDKAIQVSAAQKAAKAGNNQHAHRGWLPEGTGKILSASVQPVANKINYFKVKLTVSGDELYGFVAFLLNDAFNPEIVCKEAANGKCEHTIIACESFTAAAYTEDGTMLELNLASVEGFPEDFYFIEPSNAFRKIAASVDRTRNAVFEVDRNQWKSSSKAENLAIKAFVDTKKKGEYYRVTAELSSIDPTQILTGEVVFFLAENRTDRLRFTHAKKGIARIVFWARKAFTLGVYTINGTTLELDLRQQTGLPEGFYP